ncbi:MAG TPA: DUF192 domain-containing protein [Acidimicrobiales bacterium]|nr:DUF192 domain-containing protein [Acidimicrobiales bacterium]
MADPRDPLLDPPSWAPSWLPTVDDVRGRRIMRWVVGGVFAAGLAGCVAEGANQPADPVVEDTTETAAPDGSLAARFGAVAARLVAASGEVLELCLLHADTQQERARGLMQVTDLEGHDGMLFTIEQPTDGAFYMYDTVLPLTIGWFGPDGAFVSRADMAPCASEDPDACERYPSGGAWTSSIEVAQGSPVAERFAAGTRLEVPGGACPA